MDDTEVIVADVAKADLSAAMKGVSALIVATSATPKPVWSSFPGFFWSRFVMKEKVMPKFTFPATPEQVGVTGRRFNACIHLCTLILHISHACLSQQHL